MKERAVCDNCNGKGKIPSELKDTPRWQECWKCRGTGFEDPYAGDTPVVAWPRVYGKYGEVVVKGNKMTGGSDDERVQIHRRKVKEVARAIHSTAFFVPEWARLGSAEKSMYLTAAEAAIKAMELHDAVTSAAADRGPAQGTDECSGEDH